MSYADHCQECWHTHFCFYFLFYVWFTYEHAGLSNTQESFSTVSKYCLLPVGIKSMQNTEYIKRCFLEHLVYLSHRNEGARPTAVIILPLQTQIWTSMMSLSSVSESFSNSLSTYRMKWETAWGGLDCYQHVWSFQVLNFQFSFVSATHLWF